MHTFLIFILSLLSTESFGENNSRISPEVEEVEAFKTFESMTTYYFIRHAEKDINTPTERNPDLSEEGKTRARKWAEIFKETEFDLIFSSDYKRTQQTARAIAGPREMEVQSYNPAKAFDKDFRERTKGKQVLIVGHSNTNPAFVNKILEEKKFQDLPESEYGSLYIINIAPDGTKNCQVMYIN